MPSRRLKQFLDENSVKYSTISHSPAFSAQELAARTHFHGQEIAKITVFKAGNSFALAVLSAPDRVDFRQLGRVVGSHDAQLATEEEFAKLFPECEVGAMPPFGNLYGLPVYVDKRLASETAIVFNAGNHREAMRVDMNDFTRLCRPTVGTFATNPNKQAA